MTIGGETERVHFVVLHAKATTSSNPADDYFRRLGDARQLKDFLDASYADEAVIVLGDFNGPYGVTSYGPALSKVVRAVTSLSAAKLASLPGVTHIESLGVAWQLLTPQAEDTVRALLAADDKLTGLEVTGASLEEAFLAITNHHQPANNEVGHDLEGVSA